MHFVGPRVFAGLFLAAVAVPEAAPRRRLFLLGKGRRHAGSVPSLGRRCHAAMETECGRQAGRVAQERRNGPTGATGCRGKGRTKSGRC